MSYYTITLHDRDEVFHLIQRNSVRMIIGVVLRLNYQPPKLDAGEGEVTAGAEQFASPLPLSGAYGHTLNPLFRHLILDASYGLLI